MKKLIKKTAVATLFLLTFVFFTTVIFAGNNGDNKSKKKDIVTIAVESGSFNTLVTALKSADLVSALQGDGPFTVFAPTDEAFAKLPKGTVEKLLKDKKALSNILLYHVVSGQVTSSDVVKLTKATTLSKKDVKVMVKDGKVYINDSIVTGADIMASNGVIHVIDTVLIPSE